ncbi:MAG: hypothetical protein RBU27_14285 [Bacteroidota bacterium]|jgi:hypothetical protein|nr:hypothetical protein [Bacteroidota bacterium]
MGPHADFTFDHLSSITRVPYGARALRLPLALWISLALCFAATLVGCGTPQEEYAVACDLIGELRFDEASALLAELDPRQLTHGDPATARYLCAAGALAKEGKFGEAFERMVEVGDNDRWSVIVHPEDPLHTPALNLALWIKVFHHEQRIQELLAMDPETEEFGLSLTGLQPTAYALEVLDSDLPEFEADESYIGGDYSVPRIMYASFTNVDLLPAYEKALRGMKEMFGTYLARLEKHEALYMAFFEAREEPWTMQP